MHGNLRLLYLCTTNHGSMAKTGAGRPKIKDAKENVPLRLRGSLREKVQRAADKADRSLSYMLEKAIEEKYA